MIQRLSSIRITFYSLIALVVLLGWGTALSRSHKAVFNALNHKELLSWLIPAWQGAPQVVIWFSALCLTAGLLLINGGCCCFARQLMPALRTRSPRQWLFFTLHCLFLVVLACHGMALGLSKKQSQVTLFTGRDFEFHGFRLVVEDIVFSDDLALLSASKSDQRALMTLENIRLANNWADLVLEKAGKRIARHRVYMLSPMRHGFLQVTLTQFTLDPATGRLGVTLNFTQNYFNLLFFGVYAVMILAMAGFTALTWKS